MDKEKIGYREAECCANCINSQEDEILYENISIWYCTRLKKWVIYPHPLNSDKRIQEYKKHEKEQEKAFEPYRVEATSVCDHFKPNEFEGGK